MMMAAAAAAGAAAASLLGRKGGGDVGMPGDYNKMMIPPNEIYMPHVGGGPAMRSFAAMLGSSVLGNRINTRANGGGAYTVPDSPVPTGGNIADDVVPYYNLGAKHGGNLSLAQSEFYTLGQEG